MNFASYWVSIKYREYAPLVSAVGYPNRGGWEHILPPVFRRNCSIQDAHSRPVGIAPRRLYGVYRIKDSSPADYRTPLVRISVYYR